MNHSFFYYDIVGEEIYVAVMTHIYPLMKEKFATIEHVSFFVELTTISLESSRPEFQNLFTFLCLDEKIDPRFVTFNWDVFNCLSRFVFFYLQVELEIPSAVVRKQAIFSQYFTLRGQLSNHPHTKLVSVKFKSLSTILEFFFVIV